MRYQDGCKVTYARHTRVPVVKGSEVVNQVREGRDLALRVVTHDLLSGTLGRDARVAVHLALDETLQARGQGAIGDGLVVGSKSAVELEVVTSDSVVRVVQDGIIVLVHIGPLLAVGVVDILGVPEGAVVDNVVETVLPDTTQDIVESAVLQQDPDDVLNLVLHVGNGLLGARCVAKRLRRGATDSSGQGAARQAEQGQESVCLHD